MAKGLGLVQTILIGMFPPSIAGARDAILGEKIAAKMERLGPQSTLILSKAMYTAAHNVLIPWMKARVKANRSVFRGQLHQRISAKARVTSTYKCELDFGALGVRYSLNVEKGAGPHEANIRKIRQYVTKKMGFRGEQATQIAIAIHDTIKRSGSKPHPFVMPVWERGQKKWKSDVLIRLNRALSVALKK